MDNEKIKIALIQKPQVRLQRHFVSTHMYCVTILPNCISLTVLHIIIGRSIVSGFSMVVSRILHVLCKHNYLFNTTSYKECKETCFIVFM